MPSGLQQDPGMQEMMSAMNQPNFQELMSERLNLMRDDPEIANIVKDVETRGPSAMMRSVSPDLVYAASGGRHGVTFV